MPFAIHFHERSCDLFLSVFISTRMENALADESDTWRKNYLKEIQNNRELTKLLKVGVTVTTFNCSSSSTMLGNSSRFVCVCVSCLIYVRIGVHEETSHRKRKIGGS